MRGNVGKLCFSQKESLKAGLIGNDTNEENDCNHVDGDAADGPENSACSWCSCYMT